MKIHLRSYGGSLFSQLKALIFNLDENLNRLDCFDATVVILTKKNVNRKTVNSTDNLIQCVNIQKKLFKLHSKLLFQIAFEIVFRKNHLRNYGGCLFR